MIFNVKEPPYNALGKDPDNYPANDSLDDQPAIQRAIEDAGRAGGGIVYLPQGTYRLKSGLTIEHDGVILVGDGRATILRHPANVTPFVPVVFHKASASGGDPGELRNVGVRDLAVEFVHLGPSSAPGVQLNRCIDWFCERVTVRGDGAGMGGSPTNGIAVAFGSCDGVISGCVVDGVSKPAFYISWGERISVIGCTAKNIRHFPGAPPDENAAAGFAAGQARNVAFIDCHAVRCDSNGFQITNMAGFRFGVLSANLARTELTIEIVVPSGPAPGSLAPMTVRHLGIYDPKQARYVPLPVESVARIDSPTIANRWTVTLSEPSPVPLVAGETFVQAGFGPYRGVSIIGGSSCDHGAAGTLASGVGVGSLLAGAVGKDLLISGLTCSGNAHGAGISASSVDDLVITGCILRDNQSGMLIEDIGSAAGLTGRALITGCQIYDNRFHGIMLRAARDVSVESTRIGVTGAQVAQTGVVFEGRSAGSELRRPTRITLRGVDFGTLALPTILTHKDQTVAPSYGSEHAVESGFYSLEHGGAPEGVIYAPRGSEYTDTVTGTRYRKVTAGTSRSGWARISTADDAAAEATPGTLVLRDGAGGGMFGPMVGTTLQLAGSLARGGAPATSGAIRLTNGDELRWKHALGDPAQDVSGLRVDGANRVVLGDVVGCSGIETQVAAMGDFAQVFGDPRQKVVRRVGAVTTNHSSLTTAATFSLPESSVVHIDVVVVAREPATGKSAVYRRAAGFKRHGSGDASLLGSIQTLGVDGEDDASWQVTLSTAGSSASVLVQGSGTRVHWSARMDVDLLAL